MEKKGSDHFRDILNPHGEKSNYGKIGRRRRLSKLNVFFSIILSVTINGFEHQNYLIPPGPIPQRSLLAAPLAVLPRCTTAVIVEGGEDIMCSLVLCFHFQPQKWAVWSGSTGNTLKSLLAYLKLIYHIPDQFCLAIIRIRFRSLSSQVQA